MKGQSLFEILMALGIVVLALVGLVKVATLSAGNVGGAKNQNQATRYSEAAIEWLRGQADANWNDFTTKAKACAGSGCVYCLNDLAWPQQSGSCTDNITGTYFKREATLTLIIDPVTATKVSVTVQTYWNDASGQHQVRLDTILAGWR